MIDNLVARVQVSADEGTTWTNVDEQITNGRQGAFANRVVPLGALAGQKVRLRFVLDSLGTGGWTTCCGPVGWYFDDVAITNVIDVTAPVLERHGSRANVRLPAGGGGPVRRVGPGRLLRLRVRGVESGQAGVVDSPDDHHPARRRHRGGRR